MSFRSTASDLAGTAARWGVRVAPVALACALFLSTVRAPVEARVDDALMGIGQQMMRYGDALVQDEPRTVRVNGVALHLSAGATEDDVATVLDEYERRCANPAAAAAADPTPAGAEPLPFGTPLRAGNGEHGFVACLQPDSLLTAEGVVDRARAYLTTRNLASLGHLHYVYAERREDATQFIVFRATDELNIERMFPATGDAPGEDSRGIARPPDSRRRFSLREVGYPYGITIYGGSPRSIAEHEDYYRAALEADGWRIARRSPVSEGTVASSYYAATRNGALALVVFGDERSGTSTTILTTSLANP